MCLSNITKRISDEEAAADTEWKIGWKVFLKDCEGKLFNIYFNYTCGIPYDENIIYKATKTEVQSSDYISGFHVMTNKKEAEKYYNEKCEIYGMLNLIFKEIKYRKVRIYGNEELKYYENDYTLEYSFYDISCAVCDEILIPN